MNSRGNCWGCNAPIKGVDLCPQCGRLQPGPGAHDYYSLFGFAQPLLNLNEQALEEQFHQKSRLFHPDRYQRKEPAELEISLARSAALNEAYRTLRDRRARTHYVVEACCGALPPKKNVPTELAELYFDLQDTLQEDENPIAKLTDLKNELLRRREVIEGELGATSKLWDAATLAHDADGRNEVARQLRDLLHQDNYAESMLRDVNRKLENAGAET